MVKRIFATIFAIVLALSCLSYGHAAYDFSSHVIDDAQVLSESERQNLIKSIEEFHNKYDLPIYLISTDSVELDDTDDYCDSVIENSGYDFSKDKSYALIMFNFKTNKINTLCMGRIKHFIDSENRKYITGKVNEGIQSVGYYKGYSEFISLAGDYLDNTLDDKIKQDKTAKKSNISDEKKQENTDYTLYISDDANLLTDEEEAKLVEKIKRVAQNRNISLVIVTSNDVPKNKTQEYADDFYDYGGYGLDEEKSGALLLLDMKNRQLYISTTGKMIDIIDDQREDSIFDLAISKMKSKDYYEVCNIFLSLASKYVESGAKKGTFRYDDNRYKDVDFSSFIIDDAKLFGDAERSNIESLIKRIANKSDMALVVASVDELSKDQYESYASNLYEKGAYGFDSEKSGALLLIDKANTRIYIFTNGKMKNVLSKKRLLKVQEELDKLIKDKNYSEETMKFLTMSERYIVSGPEKVNKITDLDILIAAVGGIITLLIFYSRVSSKYKFKHKAYIYDVLNNCEANIRISEDRFIRETVDRTLIETDSNRSSGSGFSGGSGTHFGSSGTSHGGGGRSF